MSGPVKNDPSSKRAQERHEDWQNDQDYVDYEDYNFDGDMDAGEVGGDYGDSSPYGSGGAYGPGGQNPYGPGSSGAGKNLSTGSSFPEPGNSEAQAYMQQLAQQGLSNTQIKQQMQAMYGYTPTDAEIMYAKQGFGGPGSSWPPSGYTQYSNTPQGKAMSKAYGTPGFQQWMDQQQQAQEAKSMGREMRKKDQEAKVKIHMILLQIMMGDIAGALRSYAVLMDKDLRAFSRLIVKKLDGVRKARSMVIRNFARTKPPRAYAGQNPQTAARAQDRSSKYTQFVQMNTQLMNELQNTERELVDALQTQFRQLETFWQTVATFRDETFRTNDRVMTMR